MSVSEAVIIAITLLITVVLIAGAVLVIMGIGKKMRGGRP